MDFVTGLKNLIEGEVTEALNKFGFKALVKDAVQEVLRELPIGSAAQTVATGGLQPAPAAVPATVVTPPAPPSAPAKEAAPAVTRMQVGEALVKLAQEKGRDAAVAVLAGLGGTKLDDIPAANYGKLLEAIAAKALV